MGKMSIEYFGKVLNGKTQNKSNGENNIQKKVSQINYDIK